MISTEVSNEKDSPQYEFVSNDLKHASEKSYIKPVGPVFLTIGTGGVELGRPDNILKPYYNAFSETGVFGILNLKIKKDGSSLEGTFYNNGDINEPYSQDTFSITKIT